MCSDTVAFTGRYPFLFDIEGAYSERVQPGPEGANCQVCGLVSEADAGFFWAIRRGGGEDFTLILFPAELAATAL